MRSYDEFIGMDKEAAPRWRKEWGSLSEAAQRRLQRPGQIASRANETAKRRHGIESIKKKFGVKYQTESPKIKDSSLIGRKAPKLKEFLNEVKTGFDQALPARTSISGRVATNTMDAKNSGPYLQGLSLAGNKDLYQMRYTNRPLYDEISSIVGAHEAVGEAMTKRRKRNITGVPGAIKNKFRGGTYFSHFSPEVLHAESAMVATASPEAKEYFKNMRSNNHDVHRKSLSAKVYSKRGLPVPKSHSEISELKDVGGIEYGKNAVMDRKKMRTHSEDYRKAENILFRNHRKLG